MHRTADISPCGRYRWTLGRALSAVAFGYGLLCLLLAYPLTLVGWMLTGADVFETWRVARAAWPIVLRDLRVQSGWEVR